MPISSVSPQSGEKIQTPKANYGSGNAATFADTLRNEQTNVNDRNVQPAALPPTGADEAADNKYIEVGQISAQNPTVSQLLHSNPEFEKNYWQIIYSDQNKNKPYTTIKEGEILSINRETKELSWQKPPIALGESRVELLQDMLKGILHGETSPVFLGTLNKTNPTVSQVIMNNEKTTGFQWNIINAAVNKDKSYSALPEGTAVKIDPDTLELVFSEPQRDNEKDLISAEKSQLAAAQEMSRIDVLKIRLQDLAQDNTRPVLLGTLSEDLPTVSHVLENNENTQALYKEIVYSDENKNKPYQSLQPGTKICIDPVTLELIFEGPLKDIEAKGIPAGTCLDKQSASLSESERLHRYVAGLEPDSDNLIKIGTLNEEQPTVSQLLINDPRFAGYHWDIIFADVNRDKPFNHLLPGTEVSINPENLELLFNATPPAGKIGQPPASDEPAAPSQSSPTESTQREKHAANDAKSFIPLADQATDITKLRPDHVPFSSLTEAERLQKAEAPRPSTQQLPGTGPEKLSFSDQLAFSAGQLVGMPSSEVDSYQLLLRGLQSQGIKYEGEKGLKENLGQLAALTGQDKSALQSVEGIVQMAGETVYARTIGAHATKDQMANFDKEISNFLKNGLVVTMSTLTDKESGIVSTLDNEWTLINADAKMVDEVPISKKIAELHEIASANNENLTVKVSRLKEDILRNTDMLVDQKKKRMGKVSVPTPR